MTEQTTGTLTLRYAVDVDENTLDEAKDKLKEIPNALQKQLQRITQITQREFDTFVQGTAKDASDTWDKTTKEMNSITGKSLWGSVKAVFLDDVWLRISKGPEVFPGALAFS